MSSRDGRSLFERTKFFVKKEVVQKKTNDGLTNRLSFFKSNEPKQTKKI